MAARPCHVVPPSQQRAVFLDARDHVARQVVVIAEADEHLVEHDVVQDRDAGLAREPVAMRAASAQQRSTRSATPCRPSDAQRGVDGEAARSARRLGHDSCGSRSPPRRPSDKPRDSIIEARCASASRDDDEPAVIGHVQPLVQVARPRVGLVQPARPGAAARHGGAPTGRTRHRHAATRRRAWTTSAIASISSNAPVFTLPAWAQTIAGASGRRAASPASASARIAALVVGGHALQRRRPEAQHLQRDRRP